MKLDFFIFMFLFAPVWYFWLLGVNFIVFKWRMFVSINQQAQHNFVVRVVVLHRCRRFSDFTLQFAHEFIFFKSPFADDLLVILTQVPGAR